MSERLRSPPRANASSSTCLLYTAQVRHEAQRRRGGGGLLRGVEANRAHPHGAGPQAGWGPTPGTLPASTEIFMHAPNHSLSSQMVVLRFVLSRPLVASAVIGATTVPQLKELIRAAEKGALPPEILERIDEVHARLPSPTP